MALQILQSRPGITADRLAERLGVTDRAARRCIATLREAGVPIESQRGRYGGYRLGRGIRLPPLVFSATEALGLVMAVLEGDHVADDPTTPVGSAIGKIIAALPENVARPAAQLRAHAAAAPNRAAAHPDVTVTSAVVSAVAASRRVSLTYTNSDGRTWTAPVDPWAVVVRYGRWYLLGYSHHAEAVRTYRIDRVEAVGESRERFEVPADLDPVRVLEEHLGLGWPLETRVTFDAPLDRLSPWVSPHVGRLSPHPEDPQRTLLEGSTNDAMSYAAEYLAAIPFDFEVEGGPELVAAVKQLADRFVRAGAGVSTGSTSVPEGSASGPKGLREGLDHA